MLMTLTLGHVRHYKVPDADTEAYDKAVRKCLIL